ncbi:SDR family NAD(P)-dependent oxidoreductase [Oceanibaculum indicum]|uniref:NAD(P)-dependent dehydrogenase (Short-subunit alcohol dehydrogenase family) n=1 Tax=Oceanibaculum indicum TaxID=526216 RepID=A0A420WS83_9PROT|nr:SDR family NAD(P)-dependent oxidoreductase [Oceanibaculum indicum]RKQ73706.1 NAD(P)-dependent dehydrogenase (short-subunit alcohol dehydrogenase family) [Oceanibaculum indicum]
MSEELSENAVAVVIGAGGGIGAAVLDNLRQRGSFAEVLGFGRSSEPALDLLDETSIERAAQHVAALPGELRLLFDASGFLHGHGFQPEKSWRDLDPAHLAHNFAVNAIGPALLMKHFLPLLPRKGKAVFATLSAKVGSIGDNNLGGWYGYRASKAALNQLVHTAAIELKRSRPQAICVALHPGTVDTQLSAPFSKAGLAVRPPEEAAADLLAVIDGLMPEQTGGFFDYRGDPLPW